jgi:hypothetical protein
MVVNILPVYLKILKMARRRSFIFVVRVKLSEMNKKIRLPLKWKQEMDPQGCKVLKITILSALYNGSGADARHKGEF